MRAAATLATALRRSFATETLTGPKAVLRGILEAAPGPMTAEAVWVAAQTSGLKSKRFTKEMLAQMRRAGALRTVPRVDGKSYGYALAEAKDG